MPKAKDPKTGKFIYAAPKAKPLPAPGAVQVEQEPKQETRRLTVELPSELHKQLRVSAATDDVSLTDFVIRTLTKGLAAP